IRSRTGGAREWTTMMRVVIIGGGPGGYEAALVAAQLGADVSLVERDGRGGSTVLTACVPSKTLIATAEVITQVREAGELGVRVDDAQPHESGIRVDNAVVNARIKALAMAQSADTRDKVVGQGVRVIDGVA